MKLLNAAFCALALPLCACMEQKTVFFSESDEAPANPGQGFASCSQTPRKDGIMPYGVGYGRYDWADFEPEDGKYDWSKIDELIENYAKIGLPVSFRITCANYHSKKPYSTPKWALDKGIKYKPYNWEKERQNPKSPFTTMTRYTPYFDEPLLIELHARFVRELAKRYDGNPHISSIDIGGYGNWGEWHTHRLGIKVRMDAAKHIEIAQRAIFLNHKLHDGTPLNVLLHSRLRILNILAYEIKQLLDSPGEFRHLFYHSIDFLFRFSRSRRIGRSLHRLGNRRRLFRHTFIGLLLFRCTRHVSQHE